MNRRQGSAEIPQIVQSLAAEVQAMIMPSAEHASIEQTVGPQPGNHHNATRTRELRAANCQQALDQMRYRLYLLDRSQRRPSIEDCVASLLESSGEKLPA